jgi:hypothetical protein
VQSTPLSFSLAVKVILTPPTQYLDGQTHTRDDWVAAAAGLDFYYSDVKALEIETLAALNHQLDVDPQTWVDWLIEVRSLASLATAASDVEAIDELLTAVSPEDPEVVDVASEVGPPEEAIE